MLILQQDAYIKLKEFVRFITLEHVKYSPFLLSTFH